MQVLKDKMRQRKKKQHKQINEPTLKYLKEITNTVRTRGNNKCGKNFKK